MRHFRSRHRIGAWTERPSVHGALSVRRWRPREVVRHLLGRHCKPAPAGRQIGECAFCRIAYEHMPLYLWVLSSNNYDLWQDAH